MLGHKVNGTVLIDKFSNQDVVNRYQVIRRLEITKDMISYLNNYENERSFSINIVVNPDPCYADDENKTASSHLSYFRRQVINSVALVDADNTIQLYTTYKIIHL